MRIMPAALRAAPEGRNNAGARVLTAEERATFASLAEHLSVVLDAWKRLDAIMQSNPLSATEPALNLPRVRGHDEPHGSTPCK